MNKRWMKEFTFIVSLLLAAILGLSGGIAAENTPSSFSLTVHTWISYDVNGTEISGKVGSGETVYFNYELLDEENCKCDPAQVGLNYSVTLNVYNEGGTVLSQAVLQDQPEGSVAVNCPEKGTITGTAVISGGADAQGKTIWQLDGDELDFLVQPTSKTALNGKKAIFMVVANQSDVTYCWYYTSTDSSISYKVDGASTDTLYVLANAQNSGRYYFCKVSDGNRTITSKKALLTTQYLISFDANDGEKAPAAQRKNNGIALKLTSSKPTLTGYDFVGWSLDEDSDTADYAPGAAFTLDEDTTLYAVWKRQTYTIQFDCNGGENGPESLKKTYGIAVKIPSTQPSRKGYTFQGWSVSETASSAGYLAGDLFRIDGDRKLYAVWKAKALYTVKFDANGGSGAPTSLVKVSQNPLKLPEDTPEWEEHRFIGWSTTSDAKYAQYSAGAYYEEDVSRTLYAVWGTARNGIDFDPSRDAYSFGNTQSSFAYSSRGPGADKYPISYDTFKILFGDGVAGKSKYKSTVQTTWGGNCCGMSSTAALFFANGMDLSSFGNGNVNNLSINDSNGTIKVRTFIEVMQIAQYTDSFATEYKNNKLYPYQISADETKLGRLYQAVESAVQSGVGTIIGIGKTGVGGHALLAYGVESVSDKQDRLLIYDCNYPNQERSLYLQKTGDGTYSGWTYDMGGYGIWGITEENQGSCFISYISYSTIKSIWNNRGHMYDSREMLSFSGGNLSVLNMEGEVVATVKNGHLSKSTYGVVQVPNLSMGWSDTTSVFLPRDFYTVVSNDSGTLEVTMTDVNHSATVTTTSNSVSFAVDSYTNENTVFIENASVSDEYSVQLSTSKNGVKYETVSVSGFGQNGSLSISGNDDTLSILNCNITSLAINGEQQVIYVTSAYAGNGGSITPEGDSIVAAGKDITYKIIPDPGYAIASVRLDSVEMGCIDEFTFRNVNQAHTIVAQFVKTAAIVSAGYDSSERKVAVTLQYDGDAQLMCAVYSNDGRMLHTVLQPISAGQNNAEVAMDGIKLKTGQKIKVMLIDNKWKPLCPAWLIDYE